MFLAHMNAGQSEAIFRFVILAAIVLVVLFLVVNASLMWAASKSIAKLSHADPVEGPSRGNQYSLKTLLSLTTFVAVYAALIRSARWGGVESAVTLILGWWFAVFAGTSWALWKSHRHEQPVWARPIVLAGAAAGAAAAGFHRWIGFGFFPRDPFEIILFACGGAVAGSIFGLVYFVVARRSMKTR